MDAKDVLALARGLGKRGLRAIPVVGEIAMAIKSVLPHLHDEAVVTVVGAPGATKRQLYFLAAAVGFSLVRRYDIFDQFFLPAGYVSCEYDAASNTVTFAVKYKTCLTTATWDKGWTEISTIPVYSGPNDFVVGSAWNFQDKLFAGIPGIAAGVFRGPALPFADRTVLTTATACNDPNPAVAAPIPPPGTPAATPIIATPNPRPVGDARSRGSLVDLVYSALTSSTGQGRKTFPTPNPALPNFLAGQ